MAVTTGSDAVGCEGAAVEVGAKDSTGTTTDIGWFVDEPTEDLDFSRSSSSSSDSFIESGSSLVLGSLDCSESSGGADCGAGGG